MTKIIHKKMKEKLRKEIKERLFRLKFYQRQESVVLDFLTVDMNQ